MYSDLANDAWLGQLRKLYAAEDRQVAPRGMQTREILGTQLRIMMDYPVITFKRRALNYKFMAAEAYWIITGDNSVAGIAPYNKNISSFSNNGVTFDGAYGPEFIRQLHYVVSKLAFEPDTRQAVLTTWKSNPGPSKDIPCTVSMQFLIRRSPLVPEDTEIHTVVNMRSSDIWLGVPYDIFNFTMMTAYVAATAVRVGNIKPPRLGTLFLNIGSSHLYASHLAQSTELLNEPAPAHYVSRCRPLSSVLPMTPEDIVEFLESSRHHGGISDHGLLSRISCA
jgi:thymidylate synthase